MLRRLDIYLRFIGRYITANIQGALEYRMSFVSQMGAMLINNLIAGLAGILVPVTLDRRRIDPAVSSAVFVTMATDVMGFLSFLGLAQLTGLAS